MNRKKSCLKIIDELANAFDLDFSDQFTEDSVRSKTFKHRVNDLTYVKKVVECTCYIDYALFVELGIKHPTPYIAFESETDLHGSIYLALGGYYRQALICLRAWLELTIVGIYYGRNYEVNDSEFEKWKRGDKQSPSWSKLLNLLSAELSFKKANEVISLEQKLKDFYWKISSFAHGRGMELYDLQRGRDNVPRFLDHSFDIWILFLKQAYALWRLSLYSAYHQSIHNYLNKYPNDARGIADILPEESLAQLEVLSRSSVFMGKRT